MDENWIVFNTLEIHKKESRQWAVERMPVGCGVKYKDLGEVEGAILLISHR